MDLDRDLEPSLVKITATGSQEIHLSWMRVPKGFGKLDFGFFYGI